MAQLELGTEERDPALAHSLRHHTLHSLTRAPVNEGISAVTHMALQQHLWPLLIPTSQTVQRQPPPSPLDWRLMGPLLGQVWTETIKTWNLPVVIFIGEAVCPENLACLRGCCFCLMAALPLETDLAAQERSSSGGHRAAAANRLITPQPPLLNGAGISPTSPALNKSPAVSVSLPGFLGPALSSLCGGGSQTGTRHSLHPLQTRCFLPCLLNRGMLAENTGQPLSQHPLKRCSSPSPRVEG